MKSVMVIAPSKSLANIRPDIINIAISKLNSIGYKVEFAKNVNSCSTYYKSGTIQERIDDINEAFQSDSEIILSAIGGFNSNQLLPYIDYDLIRKSSKFLCGFSDITVILNAIYAKTGVVTYYGPHFSSFGMLNGLEYTVEKFLNIVNSNEITVSSSEYYRDDLWYVNQDNQNYFKNNGLVIVNQGMAQGIILGGNLCSFNLLQGTEFMPFAENIILFIEDGEKFSDDFMLEFDRNLESILQSNIFPYIRGIVIGKCQKSSKMTLEKWSVLIKEKKQLKNIPVVVDANFGHTTPIFTFPIGGYAELEAIDTPKIFIRKDKK